MQAAVAAPSQLLTRDLVARAVCGLVACTVVHSACSPGTWWPPVDWQPLRHSKEENEPAKFRRKQSVYIVFVCDLVRHVSRFAFLVVLLLL